MSASASTEGVAMTDMNYVRLFAGPDGESHFEDVVVEFISEPPARFAVSEWQSAERIIPQFPPDLEPSNAPRTAFSILLAGSWTMQTSDGEVRDFHPGDLILVEDTTGKGHITSITSDGATIVARIQVPGSRRHTGPSRTRDW